MKVVMTFKKLAAAVVIVAALGGGNCLMAAPFQVDYANTTGSFIQFDGSGNFTFTPNANNFRVTSGTAAGLVGEITGVYSIGAISVVGPLSSASVTGSGQFIIHDGAFDFTAALSWIDISQNGTGGALNSIGTVNVTAISYAGSNADLLALMANGFAYNVLTFQFAPAVDLAVLKTQPNQTSFSGTVTTAAASVPDGGTTVILLGAALSGIAWVNSRRKV